MADGSTQVEELTTTDRAAVASHVVLPPQDVRRRNLQARHRIVQELRKLAGPQAAAADETRLREHLKALREHEERATAEVRKAYDALDEVLDARQQARFRLFEERLELRKMDLLMRARQGAARRQNR